MPKLNIFFPRNYLQITVVCLTLCNPYYHDMHDYGYYWKSGVAVSYVNFREFFLNLLKLETLFWCCKNFKSIVFPSLSVESVLKPLVDNMYGEKIEANDLEDVYVFLLPGDNLTEA